LISSFVLLALPFMFWSRLFDPISWCDSAPRLPSRVSKVGCFCSGKNSQLPLSIVTY
jgi:hypothetical protein